MFNQLREIRKKNELKYKKTVVLPQLVDKFHTLNSKESLFAKRIQKFLRKNYFKTAVNISETELFQIPGQFRIRFTIGSNNLNKLEKPKQKPKSNPKKSITKSYMGNNSKFPGNGHSLTNDFEDEIKEAMNKSVDTNGIEGNEDDELNKAIIASLGGGEINEEEQLLNKAIHDSLQDISDSTNVKIYEEKEEDYDEIHSIEEQILNQMIEESLQEKDKNVQDDETFNVILDMRFYGPDPYQPIYYKEIPYYLNSLQKERLTKEWNKVNPNTTNGIIFEQNYNYYESLSKDMYKK